LPITNAYLTSNVVTNYVTGANLQDVSGKLEIVGNQFNGRTGVSTDGLNLSAAANSDVDLLLTNNTSTNNSGTGFTVIAKAGSTIEADDPDGAHCVTGILDNTATGNGTGFLIEAQTGSTIKAVVERNTASANSVNGMHMRSDGGLFNLASLRTNTITGFSEPSALFNAVTNENGVLLHYLNGGNFLSQSEDINEDTNFNGVLDAGEDLNGNGTLDAANGVLDAFEDLNGNGILDQGIVSNTIRNNVGVGLSILGEDSGVGAFTIGGPVAGLGNNFRQNDNAGIAVNLNDSAVASIDSMLNTITEQGFITDRTTTVGATFVVSGNTFNSTNGSNVITNLSAAADISQFIWDIDRPAGIFDHEFDTTFVLAPNAGNNDVGNPFISVNNSEIPTGLQFVNGAPFGTFPPNLVADGSQLLRLDFTPANLGAAGFNNGEQFLWQLDVDNNFAQADAFPDDVVIGNELAGSTAQITFLADFDGSGTFTERTFSGQLQQSATNAAVSQLALNADVVVPIFKTSPTVPGDGIRIHAGDNAQLTRFQSINDTVTRNKGTAVSAVAEDNSTVGVFTVQGATITDNRGRGLNFEARENAVVTNSLNIGGYDESTTGQNIISGTSFTEANVISRNSSDGVRILASGNGFVKGNLINNTIEENLGEGATLQIDNGGTLNFGDLANNQSIRRNTIRRNQGAGLQLSSTVSPTTTGLLNATVLGNNISNNTSGGIVSELNGANNIPPNPPGVQNNNRLNLVVGGTQATDSNTISGNGEVGIGVNVTGNGNANVALKNLTVNGTTTATPALTGDGISLQRSDSAVLTATLENVTSTGNAGDGLQVDAQGSDTTDVNLPLLNTPNTVVITEGNFSNNGRNGASFQTRGDATLIGDITNSQFRNNGLSGIAIQTAENSSFGDPTIGAPPGRRSLFNGLVVENNGSDGVEITATQNSRALLEINSTVNSTSISNNGGDGVGITTTGGRSDILITSGVLPGVTTTIASNGTTAGGGGNGVRWDASGTSEGVVRITKTDITGSVSGASEDTNNNGVLDAGEDVNNNGDIDVANGDGVQANFSQNATATLIVGNIGAGNRIQNNGDDGIAVTATGSSATGNPRPIITITDNIIGGTLNGLQAGNGGDGVSLNVFGGTNVGIASGAVDNTITPASPGTDIINGILGVTETGAIPQFTMTDNIVSNNNGRGVNIALTGASGRRDREFGLAIFDPVRIRLDNNTIVSNGAEGISYRADSNMNQSRFVFLRNFPDPPFAGFSNLDFSPFQAQFLNLNVGSINGNTAYLAPYLNLRTVQNSLFTVTNNTVQNNGVNGINGRGEGIQIDVGTGSYVAADIRNNAFGGNLQEDLVTSSFLSAGNTSDSVNVTGDLTFDYVYLDDTAQLDMRFLNNTGNQVAPSDFGAVFTNADPLKSQFFGAIGVTQREAALFQVDNGPNLNNPNNVFSNFGVTQDIQAAFTNGSYNIRAAADPAFPNLGFAPFLP